jgi:hypothetical protein
MSARIDWRRARPRLPAESKYGEGVLLRNGERAPVVVKDNLDGVLTEAQLDAHLSPQDLERFTK